MFTVFEAGGSVEVDTATAIRVEVGGRVVSYWPYRPLAENAALVVAHQAGHAVDNL